MNIPGYTLLIGVVAVYLIIGIGIVYNIYKDRSDAAKRFELQLALADAQKSMTSPLKFEDCRGVINNIINFYCVSEDVNRGYWKKTPEEFSLEIDTTVVHIAMLTRMAVSQEVIRQFGKFATNDGDDNYLDYYILNTVKIILIDEINNRRKIGKELEANVPRVTRNTEKNQNQSNKR